MEATAKKKTDRWVLYLAVTVLLYAMTEALWPALVRDTFSWQPLVVSVPPVIWGFSLLFLYRTKRERYVSWFAAVIAILCFVASIGVIFERRGP